MTKKPPIETEGRRLLCKLVKSGVSQSEIARHTNVEPSSVSLWCAGWTRPVPHLREILELLYKIPRESWMTKEECAEVDQARAASRR